MLQEVNTMLVPVTTKYPETNITRKLEVSVIAKCSSLCSKQYHIIKDEIFGFKLILVLWSSRITYLKSYKI